MDEVEFFFCQFPNPSGVRDGLYNFKLYQKSAFSDFCQKCSQAMDEVEIYFLPISVPQNVNKKSEITAP
jgi:hypothetical protein